MHPKHHILLGTILSIICYLYFNNITLIPALVIWFSSWLIIDLDHVIRYTIKTKNINPIKFLKWSKQKEQKWKKLTKKQKEKYKYPIFIFHNIEILIILLITALFFNMFFWVFIGFLFHLILDEIHLIYNNEKISTKISIIWILIYNSKRDSEQNVDS